jgi:DNA-binding transcriptional LysR family regulator
MDWTDRIGRRVRLRDLHILLTVVKTGSMGRAAVELAVSQPVVSKAISELETALGFRLLDRSPQGVEPTRYGRAVVKWGVAAFDDLRQGVKELEFLADPTVGELRIGCSEPLAAGFVMAIVAHQSRQYPNVTFQVVSADPVSLHTRELRQRQVELVVTPMPGLDPGEDTTVEILFEERHVVMASRNSKWARRRNVTLADRRALGSAAARHSHRRILGARISRRGVRAAARARRHVFPAAARPVGRVRALCDRASGLDGPLRPTAAAQGPAGRIPGASTSDRGSNAQESDGKPACGDIPGLRAHRGEIAGLRLRHAGP